MAGPLIIVVVIFIAVAVLALIGVGIAVLRKSSLDKKRSRAQELRVEADHAAAGLPDARARAEQAAVEAEHKRQEAERAEQEALAARTEVEQERARHEDQIRAADRLDPDVDHKAKDYSPEVGEPAGPSVVPTDPAYAEPTTGQRTTVDPTSQPDTILESDDGEQTPGTGSGGAHRA